MSLLALWLFLWGLVHPASAADPTGVLKVVSSAPGAEVWLDGASIGNAPVTKYVPAGPHKLRVVADNFEPFVRQVEVVADKTVELTAAMVPGPGSVEFTGPPGANVTVAGQTYAVPVRLASPGAGPYAWRAQAPGFEVGEGTLTLVRGRNYLVAITLESSAGVIAVTSKPAGAQVRIDGKLVGATPLKSREFTPGAHGVEVSLDGYATTYRQVDTTSERAAVDLTLGKGAGAAVVVQTGSADGVVFFNQVEVGRGQQVRVEHVARGKITVAVATGDKRVEGRVEVPSSGTLNARATDKSVVETRPLTQSWGFWAAVGGGAVAAGTTAAVVVAANQPAPPPEGDVVVTLP